MITNCTAVILAGGQSKRMGQDKASLVFEGQTLLSRAEQRLTPLFEHVVVSVREQRSDTDLRQALDSSESRAPMMGIVAAMQAVKTGWVFVVGVDMPFISAELVQYMAEQREGYDVVVGEVEGNLQPLLAFYRKEACLPVMKKRAEQKKRGLVRFIPHVHTKILKEHDLRIYDSQLRSFIDFDTQSDLLVNLRS